MQPRVVIIIISSCKLVSICRDVALSVCNAVPSIVRERSQTGLRKQSSQKQ